MYNEIDPKAAAWLRQLIADGHLHKGTVDAQPHQWPAWAPSVASWVLCSDGVGRPFEPGAFPLSNGVPARVVRIRGYGNAIVPQVAATFIESFMEALPSP